MDHFVSPARLSDLIGAIYDCAVDPGIWPATLDAIRDEMRFATAVLSSHALPSGHLLLNMTSGIEPVWADRITAHEGDIIDLWGGAEVARGFPIGEPGILSRVNPRAFEPPVHRYIVEWGQPQGLVDTMSVVVARDGASVGAMAFGRHESEGPIGEAEVVLARLPAPHIQRSVAISRILDVAASAREFGTIIDQLAVPVILVASDRLVLHLNDAARTLLREGTALASHGNRLTSREPAAALRLRDAVDQCVRDEAGLTDAASGFPVRDRDGQVYAVHVLPLGRGRVRPGLVRPAVAAVLVSRPTPWAGGVADAVAALLGLTPAETRVFELVASGSTPAEAAVALGIAPSTLRRHLLRVYDKLDVHRQADLVRLAAGMASPLAGLDATRI